MIFNRHIEIVISVFKNIQIHFETTVCICILYVVYEWHMNMFFIFQASSAPSLGACWPQGSGGWSLSGELRFWGSRCFSHPVQRPAGHPHTLRQCPGPSAPLQPYRCWVRQGMCETHIALQSSTKQLGNRFKLIWMNWWISMWDGLI